MTKAVRSLLLLLGLALLPACASSERVAAPQSHEPIAAPQVQAPAATRAVSRTVVVNFDSGSAEIRAAAMQILYGAAVDLRGARLTAVRIAGFADASGRHSYNQKLSERRAVAVADQLAKLGLRTQRMEVSGAGESRGRPRHSEADRRVEITFELLEQSAALPLPASTPSLHAAVTASQPAAIATAALILPPIGEPAGVPSPAPLRSAAKPAIKHLPARSGTTWLPPPSS